VMGHLGLTPQSVHLLGGYRAQGKTAAAAQRLFEDALILQDAGCYAIVLETIPTQLARFISEKLEIPTIGIGASAACDGQVLVTHDLLGLFDRFTPRFVKQYANLNEVMNDAFVQYKADVECGIFPADEHGIEMADEDWDAFLNIVEAG
jgi:3-methyl-2-oxobutanoate hydroxymethyltransferase